MIASLVTAVRARCSAFHDATWQNLMFGPPRAAITLGRQVAIAGTVAVVGGIAIKIMHH